MKTPLLNELEKYIASKNARFHMPGHSGICEDGVLSASSYDVTELSFNDNLNCPSGVLKELENNITTFSNTYASLMFTSGTTSAILVGLGLLRCVSKYIAIDQFSHKSVFEAARHWGYDATIIPREFSKEGIALPITNLNPFLEENPKVKIICLTSPDYLGVCLNTQLIHDLKNRGYYVFIDSAHGSHFRLSPTLPKPLTDCADIVCESWHKTLPVYTGGSILQICKGKDEKTLANFANIARMLRAKTHTTSPSYITLASIDQALSQMEDIKVKYDEITQRVKNIKEKYSKFYLNIDGEIDQTKLTLNASYEDFEKLGITPEMQFGRYTNFIITPYNMNQLDKLENALKKIKSINKPMSIKIPKCPNKLPKPIDVAKNVEFLHIEDSFGRIAATDIGSYPPGVPILYEGQKIRKDHIAFLQKWNNHTFNLVNGLIPVLK